MSKTIVSLAAIGLLTVALSACSVPTAGTAAAVAPAVAGTPTVAGSTAPGADLKAFARPGKAPTGTAGGAGSDGSGPNGSGSTGDPVRDRVLSDAQLLEPELDAFWTKELQETYGLQYVAPSDFGYYQGSDNPPCGGTQEDGSGNAYFCAADNYVAFDLDFFAQLNKGQPGDASTFLALAHEWGHSVQQNWLDQQPGVDNWQGPAQELDADCLAGVFLETEIENGDLVPDASDAGDVFSTLFKLGSMDPMNPGDHGTSEQRQQAFADGVDHGLNYCRSTY